MTLPGAKASYKKQDGFLTLSSAENAVVWSPHGAEPTLKILLPDITNLQQTPVGSPKVILKVITKSANYLFHFTSSDARAESDDFKTALTKLMSVIKSSDPSIPRPSAANSNSNSNAAETSSMPIWMDENALLRNIDLQQSLMVANPDLYSLYMESRAAKANSVSDSAWNLMFWSQRTSLLRTHAMEKHQPLGAVNILSLTKPKAAENGQPSLRLTGTEFAQLFNMYPFLQRPWDQYVPKDNPNPSREDLPRGMMTGNDFVTRFWQSKLAKKLQGKKITNADKPDDVFDSLLGEADAMLKASTKINQAQLPQMVNISGNEEDRGGFKGGNRPDIEMRPPKQATGLSALLNGMSAKIMANIPPIDVVENLAPNPQDQTTRAGAGPEELILHDLAAPKNPNIIPLQIRLPSKAQNLPSTMSAKGEAGVQRSPDQALARFRADIGSFCDGRRQLDVLISANHESDSGSDNEEPAHEHPNRVSMLSEKRLPAGSRKARLEAQSQMLEAVKARRVTEYGSQDKTLGSIVGDQSKLGNTAKLSDPEKAKVDKKARALVVDATARLSANISRKAVQTHKTTFEFLRHFYAAFRSGDADRVGEIESLAQSLRRTKTMISELALEAEKERLADYELQKTKALDIYKRTGQRVYPRKDECPGGQAALMGALINATDCIDLALKRYAEALEKEGINVRP